MLSEVLLLLAHNTSLILCTVSRLEQKQKEGCALQQTLPSEDWGANSQLFSIYSKKIRNKD